MEFKKCDRCGCFYISEGPVCPKCSVKDNSEFSNFKNYVEENGCKDSLNEISASTGIQVKHLARFVNYEDFKPYKKDFKNIL